VKMLIDVGRSNILLLTGFIDILQQFLTRQFLVDSNDLCDTPIFNRDGPFHAAFAGELEP